MFRIKNTAVLSLGLAFLIFLCGCAQKTDEISKNNSDSSDIPSSSIDGYIANVNDVPAFTNEPYVVLKDNQPDFTEDDLTTVCFERYAKLDALGRCGVTMACVGVEIMPTEERGSIGQVKPTGWHTVKFDNVDGKYLYNRCHLIGYQLTGENANRQNLITGTRYLNIEGMLPFENMVADYVKETKNHVLYRVTPIFDGNNLLASGVQLEGYSVEDKGEGICFNVYAYNCQPDILINYATGESKLDDGIDFNDATDQTPQEISQSFVLNTNTKKYHTADCELAKSIKEKNKKIFSGTIDELKADGYLPCKNCNK